MVVGILEVSLVIFLNIGHYKRLWAFCGHFGGVISCIFEYWPLETVMGILEVSLVLFLNIGHYKWLWAFCWRFVGAL